MRRSEHVVPRRDGRWAVRKSGASRASRVFATQRDAIRYAREVAGKEGAVGYVHRNDGTVIREFKTKQEAIEYGRELIRSGTTRDRHGYSREPMSPVKKN